MSAASNPRTVEEIFKDFGARRAAIIRALTSDVDEFYGLCDPEEKLSAMMMEYQAYDRDSNKSANITT